MPPIILLSGDEPTLQQDAQNEIKKHAKLKGYAECLTFTLQHSSDWGTIQAHLYTRSLFSEKSLILVKTHPKAPCKVGTTFIKEYAKKTCNR